MTRIILLAATLFVLPITTAMAQHQHGSATPATQEHRKTPDNSASNQAYRAANEKMHKDMDVVLSGNADADFIANMIPHHQGAVEMAKIVLKYGTDPEVRKLAEGIMRDQEREITQMKTWQARYKK